MARKSKHHQPSLFRRGDAAREAVPGSQGRARGPRGSSAPRDRSDAGQRKKRGEHP